MGAHGSREKLHRCASERFNHTPPGSITFADRDRERFGSFGKRGAAKKRDVIRTSPARQNTSVGAGDTVSPIHPLRHTKQGSPLRPAARPNTLLQKRGLSPASGANSSGTPGSGGGGPPAEPKVPRKLLTPKRPLNSTKSAPLKEHNRLPVTQTAAGAQQAANNKTAAAPCTPPSPAPLPPVPSIPEICGKLPDFPEKCDGGISGKSNSIISAREVAMLQKSARGVEALGVLVQYLVYNLDAFACPSLKRAQRATGLSLLEAKSNCARLEQQLADQILRNARDEAERAKIHQQSNERAEERIRSLESVIEEVKKDRDNAFNQILQLKQSHEEDCQRLQAKFSAEQLELAGEISFLRHTEQEKLAELAETRSKLDDQRAHNQTERNMYEENRNLLEQELRKLEEALLKAQAEKKSVEHEANKWRIEAKNLRADFENQVELLQQELDALRAKTAENELHHVPRTEKSVLLDEVESLRNVLELKQNELSELRKRNLELSRSADQLPSIQAKAQTLEARVEDLQVQLQRKMDDEKELYQRNKLLEESFHQESKQKTRLSQYNEELQYKLKQNHEVVNVLAAMTGSIPEGVLSPRKSNDYHHLINNNNSLHNNLHDGTNSTPNFVRAHNGSGGGRMSFNERYGSAERSSLKLERKHSFREKQDKHRSPVMSSSVHSNVSPSHLNPRLYDRHHSSPAHDSSSDTSLECKQNHKGQTDCCFEMEDVSPPSSPQIKAVVEKSDSVSWVLEIAEPPEMVASRLVRRAGSFRNSTPPPKKLSSPNHQNQQQSPPLLKRPRCNTGLTQRIVAGEVTRQNSDPTSARKGSNGVSGNKLTRSASMGCAAMDDSLLADWSSCRGTSTPYKSQENSRSYHQNGVKDTQLLITCDTAVLTSRCDELCPTLPAHRSLISDQRSESPASSVSDDSENSVDDCDKKSEENRMDGSWSEDGDTDI